jgi:competence protein ComEA
MRKVRFIIGFIFLVLAVGFVAYASDGTIYPETPGGLQTPDESSGPTPDQAGVINVNTASQDQLTMLPLIDDQLAINIVDYRNTNGPFNSLDDLMNVKGMTQEKLDQIRPYLVLQGDTTFNPDIYKK